MADNRFDRPIGAMAQEQRSAAIEKAESERLRIISSIEEKMKEFSKATGKRSLAKRKAAVGKAPNDWKKKGNL